MTSFLVVAGLTAGYTAGSIYPNPMSVAIAAVMGLLGICGSHIAEARGYPLPYFPLFVALAAFAAGLFTPALIGAFL